MDWCNGKMPAQSMGDRRFESPLVTHNKCLLFPGVAPILVKQMGPVAGNRFSNLLIVRDPLQTVSTHREISCATLIIAGDMSILFTSQLKSLEK